MGFAGSERIRRRTACLVGLLFLIFQPILFSQTERPAVEILPNPVGVNDRFTVSFILPTPSAADVGIGSWEYPEGVRLYAGPYIRGIVETRPDGSVVPLVSVSYILRASESGIHLFPSIPYRINGRPGGTREELLRVGTYRDAVLSIPLDLQWRLPEGPFYQGQTIPVQLMIENLEEPVQIDRISVEPSEGGFFEKAPDLQFSETRRLGPFTLVRQAAGGFLFTPTGTGRYFLNRAEVEAGERLGTSAAVALEVLPLPEAVRESGAVGSFDLKLLLESRQVEAGEEFQVTLRLEGQGNLNYLTMPGPVFDGALLLREDEQFFYQPAEAGYSGYRIQRYILEAEEAGEIRIQVPAFPYLDPRDGRPLRIPSMSESIEVLPGNEPDSAPLFVAAEFLYTPAEVEEAEKRRISSIWPLYLLFLPGPILLLVLRLRRRFGRKSVAVLLCLPLTLFLMSAGGGTPLGEELSMAQERFLSGDYAGASELYTHLVPDHAENGRLLFNYSLALGEEGRQAEAVSALLAAHRRLGPTERVVRYWNELSLRGEYQRQFALSRFYFPELAFLLLLVFYNLLFLSLILSIYYKSSLLLLATLLVLTLDIGLAGLFIHGQVMRKERFWVIREDLVTRRIPRENAQEWVAIPAGLAVRVTQQSGAFLLVETAYGAEGWIADGQLLREEDLLLKGRDG